MKAIAYFDTSEVKGSLLFVEGPVGVEGPLGVTVYIHFTELPPGSHGLHIHKAGDLRQGCTSLCDHWHVGPPSVHGGPPGSGMRHTGDLGNVHLTAMNDKVYILDNVTLDML
jgi:Cu/Zn superoxide dismutase